MATKKKAAKKTASKAPVKKAAKKAGKAPAKKVAKKAAPATKKAAKKASGGASKKSAAKKSVRRKTNPTPAAPPAVPGGNSVTEADGGNADGQ